jgi:hypothetical protein
MFNLHYIKICSLLTILFVLVSNNIVKSDVGDNLRICLIDCVHNLESCLDKEPTVHHKPNENYREQCYIQTNTCLSKCDNKN